MAAKGKQRDGKHIIGGEAEDLLRSIIPKHWVLRAYQPDYGLDFALEIFRDAPDSESGNHQTLGEHIFIQLKGARKADRKTMKVEPRANVEKPPPDEAIYSHKRGPTAEIEVLPVSIEMSELVTIQRMGAALPVLLVRADLSVGKCYFVCLNDYIEKLLIPKHEDYTATDSRTIHVPANNDLSTPEVGATALRWHAKRAKLFAGFQKFIYQSGELVNAQSQLEMLKMAEHFAATISRYDFWDETPMWPSISIFGQAVKNLVTHGSPQLMKIDENVSKDLSQADLTAFAVEEICELWRCLTNLPRSYEEVCKEWFLPTSLGLLTSYPIPEIK